jgi:very-short-patch-repair endonuclease
MREKGLPHPASGDKPLAELAKGQHGVVSVRQLKGPLGYSESAIGRAVAAGRLHRLHRGVYAVGHTSVSWHGRCLAAVLGCGPHSLLSHRSAAWLWGISRGGPFPVHVTSPVPRKARPPIALHHSRTLSAEDRGFRQGIPVTAVPRTLLDRAIEGRRSRLERDLERAEELALFDLAEVESLLARNLGHPGHGPLRSALELYREPVFTRSGLERRFLALVREAGLPRPSTGFNVAGYELDAYWPGKRFAVELDAFETHGTRASFERDRLRQEDLKLAGVEMVRITGKRLEREPRQVIERVARLLGQRKSAAPSPAGG